MEDDDTDSELAPPRAQRVAHRALALASVVCRGFIEKSAPETWAKEMYKGLQGWLPRVGLLDELEPWELTLLRKPLGKLGDRDRINATWLSEGISVLAWSLGHIPMPAHDHAIDPKAVADQLGLLSPRAAKQIEEATLHPAEEIEEIGELLFAVHWRLRDYSINPRAIDLKAVGRNAWMGDRGIRRLPLLKGDLAILGKQIAETEEREWRHCLSIASERHQAVNWLLGFNPVYSEVDTST